MIKSKQCLLPLHSFLSSSLLMNSEGQDIYTKYFPSCFVTNLQVFEITMPKKKFSPKTDELRVAWNGILA